MVRLSIEAVMRPVMPGPIAIGTTSIKNDDPGGGVAVVTLEAPVPTPEPVPTEVVELWAAPVITGAVRAWMSPPKNTGTLLTGVLLPRAS